jgi:beta-N-acetylhexosaminidase/D-alanyl-D-alanine dipeptidase
LPADPRALVDVEQVIPGLLLDMRYASKNNFTGKIVYPRARCLLRRPVAEALVRVQKRLQERQRQLLIWDCYRPFAVQETFWKLVPDSRYVARPRRDRDGRPISGSKHNRGAAVDLSLADSGGRALEMPTDFDDFSEKAHRGAKASKTASANAKLLEEIMGDEGFLPLPTEWWHFDFPGWRDYPLGEEPLP